MSAGSLLQPQWGSSLHCVRAFISAQQWCQTHNPCRLNLGRIWLGGFGAETYELFIHSNSAHWHIAEGQIDLHRKKQSHLCHLLMHLWKQCKWQIQACVTKCGVELLGICTSEPAWWANRNTFILVHHILWFWLCDSDITLFYVIRWKCSIKGPSHPWSSHTGVFTYCVLPD